CARFASGVGVVAINSFDVRFDVW
nr:immunoglobulin heavy chain junction region [Macaca mulatta]MOW97867.1 immunoglobulin heavy chain junction region [Macaca mulatta]